MHTLFTNNVARSALALFLLISLVGASLLFLFAPAQATERGAHLAVPAGQTAFPCTEELEAVVVLASSALLPIQSETVLTEGEPYLLVVSGVLTLTQDVVADALYTIALGSQEMSSALTVNEIPFSDLMTFGRQSIDFSEEHTYATLVAGDGAALSFQIIDSDGVYADNEGELAVLICIPGAPGMQTASEAAEIPPANGARVTMPVGWHLAGPDGEKLWFSSVDDDTSADVNAILAEIEPGDISLIEAPITTTVDGIEAVSISLQQRVDSQLVNRRYLFLSDGDAGARQLILEAPAEIWSRAVDELETLLDEMRLPQ